MWPLKIKATEQFFPVILFIMLYNVVLTLILGPWIQSCSETIQMKATEQYFPVVKCLFVVNEVVTFESVDEILQCGNSNESY